MSIELLWTLLSLTGMAVAVWSFFDALADLRVLGPVTNGEGIHARGYRRSEAVRFVIHTIMLLIGIPALLNPEPVGLSFVVAGLIAINALALTNSLLDARDRLAVRRNHYRLDS